MPDMAHIAPGHGVAFIVSATLVSDIIAKACSSPQTAELNAKKRAPTLMKWVNIGTLEAIGLVLVAATIDPGYRGAIILGAGAELLITYAEYLHAKRAGLKSDQPGTEAW